MSQNYQSTLRPSITKQAPLVSSSGTTLTKLPPDERALSLLLFQPELATLIDDTRELKESREVNIQLLAQLIDFLKQCPHFSGGQLLGHWQGTYGLEASENIKRYLAQGVMFHQTQQLVEKKENIVFKIEDEFLEVVDYLIKQEQQSSCDDIVQQLNAKPPSDWTDVEKRLYLKALRRH